MMGVAKVIDVGSDFGIRILKLAYVDSTRYGYKKGRKR